jgi:mannitol-1-/sugar-/sorbitol-6-phosphatase
MSARTGSRPVRAVLFDLDGTLVDSEIHTDAAVTVVAARHGVEAFTLPHTETRGRTWAHIAAVMRDRAGIAGEADVLAGELLAYWTEIAADVKPVPGAPEAIREAAESLPLGVVSSSPRAVIDSFLGKLGIDDCIGRDARIGGDAVSRSKPDPEGFLNGARALAAAPEYCLVFEDSQAGLLAARAAGMRSMFVRCCAVDIPGNSALATASCTDYRSLPPHFWKRLAGGSLDFAAKVYA